LTYKEPSFDDELIADEWAARKIIEHGEEYYSPFHIKSILWLFELMHFSEVVEQRRDNEQLTARRRFNSVRKVIDPREEMLPLSEIEAIRGTVNLTISNWNLLYSQFGGK
jgi:hypothetical protein